MIRSFELNGTTFEHERGIAHEISVFLGQEIQLSAIGDLPLTIEIGCFVDRPPPPRFKGCPECQIHSARSGEAITFRVDPDTWREQSGRYNIRISDASTDYVEIRLRASGLPAEYGRDFPISP